MLRMIRSRCYEAVADDTTLFVQRGGKPGLSCEVLLAAASRKLLLPVVSGA